MTPTDYAKHLLYARTLNDKLLQAQNLDWDNDCDKDTDFHQLSILMPAREKKIEFSNVQFKFPKVSKFHIEEKKAQALHSFANHELLAIEIMAYAFLKFTKKEDIVLRKTILATIKEEQKHLSLYIKRIRDLGFDFGSFPLNDYFWRQFVKVNSLSSYFATMSLTFEAANLDFALYYQNVFREVEDFKTQEILEQVYKDEIKHVRLGVHWLKNDLSNKKDKFHYDQKDLWNYYLSLLPQNVTPARARGIIFHEESRRLAGFDDDYISMQKNYRDEFRIVNRKKL